MKKSKCHIMETSVVYLGHQIDSEGLHATADKVEAMVRAPIPKNVHRVAFFSRPLKLLSEVFLPYLASLLQPLNSLLQQGCNWECPQNALRLSKLPKIVYFQQTECTKAFKTSKDRILSEKVLTHYDPMLPLKLVADTSAYGPGAVISLGAVISHILPDDPELPTAFASATMLKLRGLWCLGCSISTSNFMVISLHL